MYQVVLSVSLFITSWTTVIAQLQQPQSQRDLTGGTICPLIFYECPDNAYQNPKSPCLTSFDDCLCDNGYIRNEEEQICKKFCRDSSGYECPKNSKPKPTSDGCPYTFKDCMCVKGYIKDTLNKKCIKVNAPITSPVRPPIRTPVKSPIRPPVKVPVKAPVRSPSTSNQCNVNTGIGCKDGYTCTFDPDIVCIALVGAECPGICVPTCGGGDGPPLPSCAPGTICVNNPATPECTMEVDCNGVCLPPVPAPVKSPVRTPVRSPIRTPVKSPVKAPVRSPIKAPVKSPVRSPIKAPVKAPVRSPSSTNQCNVSTGVGCKDGYTCTYNPDIACIALVGVECPGMCVPTCGGFTSPEDALPPCPKGTTCVDNPATPDCLIAADCTGVCLSIYQN